MEENAESTSPEELQRLQNIHWTIFHPTETGITSRYESLVSNFAGLVANPVSYNDFGQFSTSSFLRVPLSSFVMKGVVPEHCREFVRPCGSIARTGAHSRHYVSRDNAKRYKKARRSMTEIDHAAWLKQDCLIGKIESLNARVGSTMCAYSQSIAHVGGYFTAGAADSFVVRNRDRLLLHRGGRLFREAFDVHAA